MHRRNLLTCGLGALAGGALAIDCSNAASGTLRVVYPFSAGGAGDVLSRLVADAISSRRGSAGIVENKTGADGRIGIQAVKHAAADGDTLLVTTGPTMWLMPLVHPAPGYDPNTDFAPISLLARFDFCIAVANATGVRSFAEWKAWLKANPAKANYGIPGLGTLPHFLGTRLSKVLDVPLTHVVYRGSAPAMNDLVSGQLSAVVTTVSDVLPQHRAGTVRMLAVSGAARSPFVPDIPTLRECGIDIAADAWYGLWAPSAVPAGIRESTGAATRELLAKSETQKRLNGFGLVAVGSTSEVLAASMRDAVAYWGPVIKETGYRMSE